MRYAMRPGYPKIQALVRVQSLTFAKSGLWLDLAKWQVQIRNLESIMVGTWLKRSIINLKATETQGRQVWIVEKDYQRLLKKYHVYCNTCGGRIEE